MNDAFEELSETERGEMDKGKRRASQNKISVFSMKNAIWLSDKQKEDLCEFNRSACSCNPAFICDICECIG